MGEMKDIKYSDVDEIINGLDWYFKTHTTIGEFIIGHKIKLRHALEIYAKEREQFRYNQFNQFNNQSHQFDTISQNNSPPTPIYSVNLNGMNSNNNHSGNISLAPVPPTSIDNRTSDGISYLGGSGGGGIDIDNDEYQNQTNTSNSSVISDFIDFDNFSCSTNLPMNINMNMSNINPFYNITTTQYTKN